MEPPEDLLANSEPHSIDRIETPVSRTEVLRYLGYPSDAEARTPVTETLDTWIDAADQCATPRAVYVVTRASCDELGALHLHTDRDTISFDGVAAEPFAGARWVAAFIATAGREVEALSRDLMSKNQLMAGMVVDAVGSERAEAAARKVLETLRRQVDQTGLDVAVPVCPGQCGFDLEHQPRLFSLFGSQTAEVHLTQDLLMRPLKSISGLAGIGPAGRIVSDGTPCDRCTRTECAMRRTSWVQ